MFYAVTSGVVFIFQSKHRDTLCASCNAYQTKCQVTSCSGSFLPTEMIPTESRRAIIIVQVRLQGHKHILAGCCGYEICKLERFLTYSEGSRPFQIFLGPSPGNSNRIQLLSCALSRALPVKRTMKKMETFVSKKDVARTAVSTKAHVTNVRSMHLYAFRMLIIESQEFSKSIFTSFALNEYANKNKFQE